MAKDNKTKTFNIKIDRDHFKVSETSLTGAQLRALPDPNLGTDVDLYIEGRGGDADRIIADDESVEIKDGTHFFTAARNINPGASR